jgi:hypothetical protein
VTAIVAWAGVITGAGLIAGITWAVVRVRRTARLTIRPPGAGRLWF